MMVEVSYQIFLSTLQTVGLLVGIFYYIFTLRTQMKNQEITLGTRHASVFHQLVSVHLTPEGIKQINNIRKYPFSSVDEWQELMKNQEFADSFMYWRMFYEEMGVFLQEGSIPISQIARYNAWFHLWIWERFREVIYEQRKTLGIKNYYYQWEYAYDTLKEYLDKHPELTP
jgi:hypothetical protein